MKKNFLFKGVSALGAMLLLATSVMPGLQYAYATGARSDYNHLTEDGIGSWDYIYDADSFNAVYADETSGLRKYENRSRYEDLYNGTRRPEITDMTCTFESYDIEGSVKYGEGKIQALQYGPWAGEGKHTKVKVTENDVEGFVNNEYYLNRNAFNINDIKDGSSELFELYTDLNCETSASINVKITGCSYPEAFQKSWSAWEPKWVVVNLPTPFEGTISISYDGAAPVYPWGESIRTFNYGYGVENISAITSETFDPSKLKVTLLTKVACVMAGLEPADNDVCYGSLRDAIKNASAGATIYLVADDHVSFNADNLELEIDKTITIDGKKNDTENYTIYGVDDYNDSGYHDIFVSAGNVTIKNLNISEFASQNYVVYNTYPIWTPSAYAGTLTLQNVNFDKFNRTAINANGGTVIVDGCTITGDPTSKNAAGNYFQSGIEALNANVTVTNTSVTGVGASENNNEGSREAACFQVGGLPDVNGVEVDGHGIITLKGNGNVCEGQYSLIANPWMDGGKIVVEGGTFDGKFEKESDNVKFEISGGKFSVDPSTYVVAGKYAKSISEGALKYEVDVKPSSSSSSGGGGGSSKKSETTKTDDAKANTGDTATVDDKNAEDKNDETKADEPKTAVDANNNGTADTAISFSQEFKDAYKFAHDNGITTKDSIEEADMYGPLTRIAMAKMLSQYAINVLGKTPDTTKVVPTFPDVSAQLDADYDNGVTLAYQLGIMGIGIENFRPFDLVTRAEFGTALSRMLYGTADGEGNEWYSTHLEKLMNEKIITNDNPQLKELRGYVMIMLMRSAKQ